MKLLRLFFLLALAVLIPFVLWGGRFEQWLDGDAGRQWLASCGPWAWVWGIGLLVADVVLPLPSTAIMSALGWLYGSWLGGLAASIGSFLSGWMAFWLSRRIGPQMAARLAGVEALERYRTLFARYGLVFVAVSRCLPVLAEVVACLAGLSGMGASRAALGLACGSLPVGFAFAWIGAQAHHSPHWALALSLALPLLLVAVGARLRAKA